MSERFVNQSEFARLDGCDEKQVRRGLARGALTANADGKLDRAQVQSGWRRVRVDSRDPPAVATAADRRSATDPLPSVGSRRRATQSVPATSTPVTLQRRQVAEHLTALDWSRTWDWGPEATHERAMQAASAAGLDAVLSDVDDDGHWGGYQLRNVELMKQHGGLCPETITGGFGFELDTFEVLMLCREHLFHPDDSPDELAENVTMRMDLLPLLAYPFGPTHRRPTSPARSGTSEIHQ